MLKAETIERALREIGKGYAQYQHFFDQLKSPSWLLPLWQSGRFRNPPPPEREGDAVRLPYWPESKYLARMASLPEAQESVAKIVLEMLPTENSRVHEDLADVALAVDPALSARLVPQACEWVKSPWKLLLPEKLGNLIAYLARGKQGQAALRLAKAVFELRPDPRASEKQGDGSLLWPEPQAWIRDYDYGRVLERAVPPLVAEIGLDAVSLFIDLLEQAIQLSQRASDSGPEDYTFISDPAIEETAEPDRLRSLVLGAARDSAKLSITAEPARFSLAIDLLRHKKWAIFRRLELYLSSVFVEQSGAFSEEVFSEPQVLDAPSTRREAVTLLRAVFRFLSGETQSRLLAWMDAGPGDEYCQRLLDFAQWQVTSENMRRVANDWRRDHLAILSGQLPPAYQEALERLIASSGPPEALDRVRRVTGGAFGPRSPRSAEELTNMSVPEVIQILQCWTPPTGSNIFEPNAEGLGRAFATTVAERPSDFVALAAELRAVDPTYVRCFFDGLVTALKGAKTFDWSEVLVLAHWVVSQPREIPGRTGGHFTNDPDWGWTRDSIIGLIVEGFEERSGRLPLADRGAVWNALYPLTQDPALSIEQETGDKFDPLFLAMNSTRGRAIDAVFQYAQWVRGFIGSKTEGTDWKLLTFADMPEVQNVLDERLDVSREPTLTVRAIYGRRLWAIAQLDWRWFERNINRILPTEPSATAFFEAAWESFVTTYHAHPTLLKILLPAYRRALDLMGTRNEKSRRQAAAEHSLAQHLVSSYWRAELLFGSGDHLLDDLYARASDELLGHTMWFIGRSVAGWDNSAPTEVYDRLRQLAERRIEVAIRNKDPQAFTKELAGFGWWFASGKFPDDWSLLTLISVLRLTKKTTSEMDVIKRLVELSASYPSECITVLSLMVEGDSDRWLLVGVQTQAEDIIRTALRSNNPKVISEARLLVENLIARGHFDFRVLIS